MPEPNPNIRLEAFCDGVFAIALTLLIIEIKIPESVHIETTRGFWLVLQHMLPSIFAFLLSFGIILITWVNHHNTLRAVDKSSHPFIYANGLMLLSVVFIPFPTALLGEHLFTDHAAPAVVLYTSACVLQAVAWNVLTRTALTPRPLTRSEKATAALRAAHRYSYYAFAVYLACTVLAFWLPRTVAAIITVIWIIWLILSIRNRGD